MLNTKYETIKFDPFSSYHHFVSYLMDAGQRSVLYWDVMRRRGNQYLEQMAMEVPHVLQFDHEMIMDGRTLPQPVNYGIIKIRPPAGTITEDRKRPFVVIDPRAGGMACRYRGQAGGDRQLPGRLGLDDAGGQASRALRPANSGRFAAVILGRDARGQPHALYRRAARRQLAHGADQRSGARQVRRRLAG